MITEQPEHQYAIKLLSQIQEMFNEDCDNFIDRSEFEDSEKATAFLHALANIAPNMIYQKLTGDEQDLLGFNHIANRLAYQFGKSDKE